MQRVTSSIPHSANRAPSPQAHLNESRQVPTAALSQLFNEKQVQINSRASYSPLANNNYFNNQDSYMYLPSHQNIPLLTHAQTVSPLPHTSQKQYLQNGGPNVGYQGGPTGSNNLQPSGVSGGGSPSNRFPTQQFKRNGTGGATLQMNQGGMVEYCEVQEMECEESSKSSSEVPEYNDYVMLDKA